MKKGVRYRYRVELGPIQGDVGSSGVCQGQIEYFFLPRCVENRESQSCPKIAPDVSLLPALYC